MSAAEEYPNNFHEDHNAELIEENTAKEDRILRDVANVLSNLSPTQLENFAFLNHRFKRIVEKVQADKEKECLILLKNISGIEGSKKTGLLSRVYEMSTALLLRKKRLEKKELKVCSCHVASMDLSRDQATVDNPNPVLVELPKHCHNIDTLILNSCNISLKGIQSLSQMTRLKSLSLSFCDHLTDEIIQEIGRMKNLKELKLSWNQSLPLEALKSLSNLNQLELFDISHTNITDRELKIIANLKSLKVLNLDDCGAISDKGIVNIQSLKMLQTLNISSCNISNTGLIDLIKMFPKLVSFTFRNNHITDKGAASLSNLMELTHLDLSWSHNLGGRFLEALSKLPKLRILDISRSKHLNTSNTYWKNFKNLMYVNLSCSNIDDEALEQLSLMPMFSGGAFANSPNVTIEGIKSLKYVVNLTYLDFTNCGLSYEEVSSLFPEDVDIRT